MTALQRRLPIVNAPVCSACRGECCKRMPGSAMPADFPDLAVLEAALRTGRWALDCWDGDPACDEDSDHGACLDRVLFPRPAIKGLEGQPLHEAWRGACTFHSHEGGCALTYEARPQQCRELVPGSPETGCISSMEKLDVALMWRPHAADLEAMLARLVSAKLAG